MEVVVVPTVEDLATVTAAWIARRITSAVRLRGLCRIGFSGGSTPIPMFQALAELSVPWDAVTVFQIDERIAPTGDDDRNATQLLHHLIRHVAIRDENLQLMPVTARDLIEATKQYDAAIASAPLDIVHLGLGDDGHTASWPPHHEVLKSKRSVETIATFNGRERMTLTPVAVNAARCRVVEVAGGSKASKVEGWLLRCGDLPIQHVRRTNTTLILDAAAAANVATEAISTR